MRRALLAFGVAAVMAVATAVVAFALERPKAEAIGEYAPPGRASATGEWRALAPATLKRTEVAAARIGGSVYVVGGFEEASGETTGALERYDIGTDRWERLRSMPIGVNHATAVAYRGRLYVHGGYRGRRDLSSATARLYRYDPRRDRWRRLPDSRAPRAAHAVAVIGGRLYAAAGANAGGSQRTMEVFDFRRRRWGGGPSLKGPKRDHTTGVAAGGFFYVLAGRDNSGPGNYRTAERYDPRRRRWTLLPAMRKARGGIASAALSRGRVVVFGGEEAAGTIGEVELFDPARRRWRSLPGMRTPRHGLGGVSLRNRVYALEGGPQPGFHFADTLEFLDVR